MSSRRCRLLGLRVTLEEYEALARRASELRRVDRTKSGRPWSATEVAYAILSATLAEDARAINPASSRAPAAAPVRRVRARDREVGSRKAISLAKLHPIGVPLAKSGLPGSPLGNANPWGKTVGKAAERVLRSAGLSLHKNNSPAEGGLPSPR